MPKNFGSWQRESPDYKRYFLAVVKTIVVRKSVAFGIESSSLSGHTKKEYKMTKEEIKEYLKENLTIHASVFTDYNDTQELKVSLYLDGELITENSCYLGF